jgi:hypothetical protein
VLSQCDDFNAAYNSELQETIGDVFALGTLITKSGHLRSETARDFYFNDDNEVAATELIRQVFPELGVRVSDNYFSGKASHKKALFFSTPEMSHAAIMHNEFTESKCVASGGKLVSLFDWEMVVTLG